MEFRTLRAFVEVVRQGGFSRAAKVVFTTQSTVSKAVRQLETELGLPLLDRAAPGVRLTTAGEVVYQRGVRLLADHDDLLEEIAAIQGLKRGRLRLGLPPIGSSILFAPVFTIYRQRHPGIAIQLVEYGSAQLEQVLRLGEIELAASLLPVSEEFAWQEVRREPLIALIPAEYGLTEKKVKNLSDLKGLPFILFEEGFALTRIILGVCRRYGFEPKIIAKSSQIDFIYGLAAAGLGVAFLPRLIAETRRDPAVRHIELVEPETDWNIAVIWRAGAYLSEAARAWLAIIQEMYPGCS